MIWGVLALAMGAGEDPIYSLARPGVVARDKEEDGFDSHVHLGGIRLSYKDCDVVGRRVVGWEKQKFASEGAKGGEGQHRRNSWATAVRIPDIQQRLDIHHPLIIILKICQGELFTSKGMERPHPFPQPAKFLYTLKKRLYLVRFGPKLWIPIPAFFNQSKRYPDTKSQPLSAALPAEKVDS
ncbi:hypothetical protein L218DRAFT_991123 [Marasmius fiardii PR-910]|nr:hypothetical protein L218DRAFT_991123 [Marasmius fiardii PR-910]